MINRHLRVVAVLSAFTLPPLCRGDATEDVFDRAELNGRLATEGFRRCDRYVEAWLDLADRETGLIPRNVREPYWNAKDAAADNYPFMVLTTCFTNRSMLDGRMRDMLATEVKLTSRIDNLPDTYDFAKRDFRSDEADLDRILFGASEYAKDGLLPLTEWLGPSPWAERMLGLVDDIWKHAPVVTKHGNIVSTNPEVNGEMLQVLSRIYWMTGDKKYLEWAVRLGDYYLLDEHHPSRDANRLRLRDHGCEVVSGLCELYATVHFALPEKKSAYRQPLCELLDRILEVGRNEHGLLFNSVDPVTGNVINAGLADTWGYTYNGFYTVYLVDRVERYRAAVSNALSHLDANYRDYPWEGDSSDGYADAIESALNLYNREPLDSVGQWIDSEIQVMWRKQAPSGLIEGWHGDGNFARTTLMYCLWKTQGLAVHPWRPDLACGAVRQGDVLYVFLTAENDWEGKLAFDAPRHRTIMHLPMDWPRINQFPEWFTAQSETRYAIRDLGGATTHTYRGKHLQNGIDLSIQAGTKKRMEVSIETSP